MQGGEQWRGDPVQPRPAIKFCRSVKSTRYPAEVSGVHDDHHAAIRSDLAAQLHRRDWVVAHIVRWAGKSSPGTPLAPSRSRLGALAAGWLWLAVVSRSLAEKPRRAGAGQERQQHRTPTAAARDRCRPAIRGRCAHGDGGAITRSPWRTGRQAGRGDESGHRAANQSDRRAVWRLRSVTRHPARTESCGGRDCGDLQCHVHRLPAARARTEAVQVRLNRNAIQPSRQGRHRLDASPDRGPDTRRKAVARQFCYHRSGCRRAILQATLRVGMAPAPMMATINASHAGSASAAVPSVSQVRPRAPSPLTSIGRDSQPRQSAHTQDVPPSWSGAPPQQPRPIAVTAKAVSPSTMSTV